VLALYIHTDIEVAIPSTHNDKKLHAATHKTRTEDKTQLRYYDTYSVIYLLATEVHNKYRDEVMPTPLLSATVHLAPLTCRHTNP
jgi:hypothetical protein